MLQRRKSSPARAGSDLRAQRLCWSRGEPTPPEPRAPGSPLAPGSRAGALGSVRLLPRFVGVKPRRRPGEGSPTPLGIPAREATCCSPEQNCKTLFTCKPPIFRQPLRCRLSRGGPGAAQGSHRLSPPSRPAPRGTAYLPATGHPWPQGPPCHASSQPLPWPHVSPRAGVPTPCPGSTRGMLQTPAGQRAATRPRPPPVPSLFPLSPGCCSPAPRALATAPRESDTTRCNSCAPLCNRTRALGTLAVGFWRAGSQMLRFVHAPEQPCSSAPRSLQLLTWEGISVPEVFEQCPRAPAA